MTSLLKLTFTITLLGQAGAPARANSGAAAMDAEAPRTLEASDVGADREIAGPRRSGTAARSTGTGVGSLAEGLWPLGVVLGLILGGAVVLRRVFSKRGGAVGGELIRVISRQYLSPKQSICLVKVGSRVMALGITAERISMLAQIEDETGASRLVGAAEMERAHSMSGRFQAFLTGASSDFGEAPERVKPRDALTAVRRLRESVRGAGRPIARV